MILCQSLPGSSCRAGGAGTTHVPPVLARLVQPQQQRERREAGDNGHPARDSAGISSRICPIELHVESVR